MSSDDSLDRCERHVTIDADAAHVWELISRPGWWINDGEIVDNASVERHGEWDQLHDPVHGVFSIRPVRLAPPRYAAFRWKRGGGQDRRGDHAGGVHRRGPARRRPPVRGGERVRRTG